MTDRKRQIELALIVCVVLALTVVHAMSGADQVVINGILLRALYAPVVWAAVRGGVSWGAGMGVLAAALHSVAMLYHGGHHGTGHEHHDDAVQGHSAAFFSEHWLETPFLLLIGAGVGYLVDLERKRRAERDKTRHLLERYLSPDVAEHLLKEELHKAEAGVRRKATIMFTDLRNFTPTSEKLPPEKIVSILNEYFTLVSHVVASHRGTIDKFLGDGAMILFGFPLQGTDDAARALRAGLELQRRFVDLHWKWMTEHGPALDDVGLGIGIGTGEVIIGNIGSEMRMDYTAIGDTVNLASRLCGKAEAQVVIVGRSTLEQAESALDPALRSRVEGPVEMTVKGKTEPQQVYRLTIPPSDSRKGGKDE